MNRRAIFLAVAIALGLALPLAEAADVVVQPAAGSGFVVKDASGANERLRVQESGAVSLPGVVAAPSQSQGLCMSASGQLGPCSSTGGATLPVGTVNQTLRYDASNALVTNNLLRAYDDGGLTAGGTLGVGSIPATGAGVRLMWYPAKAALRAGSVDAGHWDDGSIGQGSIALGKNTVASGGGSMATGIGTLANADGATAMGENTKAIGNGSTAMGAITQATGIYATAMSVGTIASGGRSTAMGSEGTTASGGASTAMGDNTTADGLASTAMGSNTKALKNYSTAMGARTIAEGDASMAMGSNTQASGEYSTAMGEGTKSAGFASTTMGMDTKASASFSTAMGKDTTADGNASIAMGYKVGSGGHDGSFIFGDTSSRTAVVNSADNQFMVVADGGVVLTTNKDGSTGVYLDQHGSGWNSVSDRNAKTAVQPVDPREVLKKVAALPMSTWQYKAQEADYRHMGPMAQDFYAAFHLGNSDKSINTIDADGVALAAIQGLNAALVDKDREITDLRTELATQKKLLAKQQMEIAAQKARIASLESHDAELAEIKAQVAMLRKSASTEAAVALQQSP